MRRYLILGLALTSAGAVFTAAASAVTNVNKSNDVTKFTPATIPAGTFKPGQLHVTDSTIFAGDTGTGCGIPAKCPSKLPDPTTHVNQFFTNQVKITVNNALAQCDPLSLDGTTTAQAEAKCGPGGSQGNAELTLKADGTPNHGTAFACVAGGITPGSPCLSTQTAVVTAYNGPPRSVGNPGCTVAAPAPAFDGTKCPTILIHAFNSTIGTILIQSVLNGCTSGSCLTGLGYRLDVPVELLGGGSSALTYFDITVRRKWTSGTKTFNYLKATCPAPAGSTAKWRYKADFTYNSGATESVPATGTKAQTCTSS